MRSFSEQVEELKARLVLLDIHQEQYDVVAEALLELGFFIPILSSEEGVRNVLMGAGMEWGEADRHMVELRRDIRAHYYTKLNSAIAKAKTIARIRQRHQRS